MEEKESEVKEEKQFLQIHLTTKSDPRGQVCLPLEQRAGCGGGGERVHRLSRRNHPQPIGETKLRLFENSKLEIRENHQQGWFFEIMSIRSFTSIHKLSIYNGYE